MRIIAHKFLKESSKHCRKGVVGNWPMVCCRGAALPKLRPVCVRVAYKLQVCYEFARPKIHIAN